MDTQILRKDFAQGNPQIATYVQELLRPEDEILAQARGMAEAAELPPIQVSKFDVRHLEVLVRACGARKVVEIGTLGGYSAMAIARALGPKGVLYTFEMAKKHAEVAKAVWQMAETKGAKLARIELTVGPALEGLKDIENEAPFDIVFIDADKSNYINYFEWAYRNLRVGGTVIIDNTFAFGYIHDISQAPNDFQRRSVAHLREFNSHLCSDRRFLATYLPTTEGMAVAVKL